jgi:hypothetical protein
MYAQAVSNFPALGIIVSDALSLREQRVAL